MSDHIQHDTVLTTFEGELLREIDERAKTATITPEDVLVARQCLAVAAEFICATKPVEEVAKTVAAIRAIRAEKGETFGL